ncbi:MATE family efflux transporter [Paludibacterium yongneupense]|uniref:MATE family efflux transporter n=1 Tax=Paludibacterium yongneupense TaxID=400061 RepID=UPI000408F00A|nr:MATE family efflux transporter [Paludibacterium yongneupense]
MPTSFPPAIQAPSTRQLIRFTIPVMLAALATPLMGLVDTAVLARLGDNAVLAAAAIGTTLFTVIYWCFSFLRFTTTGLVAQAAGQHDREQVLLAGLRPMIAALAGGIAIFLLQWPIARLALWCLSPPPDVAVLARHYFDARIVSAPFTLLAYAQFAWLLGLGHSRQVMLLQLFMNGLNAALALLFVLGLHWGIAGAGAATALSETLGSALALRTMFNITPWPHWRSALARIAGAAPWRRLFAANLDIMVRTLLLTAAFALMTREAARLGTITLAANQIVLQAFMVIVSLLDGFATAAEVYGARAIGAASRQALTTTIRRCGWLSMGWGLVLTIALAGSGHFYLAAITPDPGLRQEAARYWPWLVALPLVSTWAFFWDGVFMGALRTRTLRNAMLISFGLYLPCQIGLSGVWANHGIWAALVIFMLLRGLLLTLAWPGLKTSIGASGC